MEEARQEKLKISNDLLDAMLVGVKTQDDLWGKEGIINGVKCVEEVDNADKQLVKSVKPLLCEIRGSFSQSGLRKISYTVYLTDPPVARSLSLYLALSLLSRNLLNLKLLLLLSRKKFVRLIFLFPKFLTSENRTRLNDS